MISFPKFASYTTALLLLLSNADAIRLAQQPHEKITTSEEARPWYRTIYSTEVELVTPTVIGGVTFSAKPPQSSESLAPWVSLNKEGEPKIIRPELKNGRIKKGLPDYKTYFQTLSIKTLGYDELKAKNMDPNDVFEEEVWIEEDPTYVSLNPIIRCTPDRFFHKGLAREIISDPFCTPRENVEWEIGKTYFITWYTHSLIDESTDIVSPQARIHLSYVKESPKDVRYRKRDGSIPTATFFMSKWVDNVDGVMPMELKEDWLQGRYERLIMVSVQPSHIADEDFDPMDNGVMIRMRLGARVVKQDRDAIAMRDAGMTGEKWYYVLMAIPTAVVVALFGMYFFLHLNRGTRDISGITQREIGKKRKVLGSLKDMKYGQQHNHLYSELPVYNKGPKHS
ncbi:hypothetical protein TBLA_0H02540 [Henningerozyma blattae CBS 6284]|uniref:Uncharacterized protein n=1 Tax=Henningerozyma blattae (strain ATCC 34711 / CBS 6284 / DSM 70876 / NBRC 10599 / NRRL Y-10934 / UCD 77-7) TaxID=1071380 RepID=I2H836_HENB6|nr:hypothetical protein TBLA_0H02540 [Tetrapisispora blattae CBS 6284]CCH62538.1 hypothetical protein TBLA_0H02540 [Tetrapisispora blattae CBS 6284]